jgi:hypothetical protein
MIYSSLGSEEDLLDPVRNLSCHPSVLPSSSYVGYTRESDGARMRPPHIGGVRLAHVLSSSGCSAVFMMFVVVWILPGCGAASQSSQTSATSVATGAPTSADSKINGAVSNVCPITQAPEEVRSFSPDIIVTEGGDPTHALNLQQRQRLEIRLDSQVEWELHMDDPHHALVSAGPQGWYDAASRTCVWRFTAQGAGDAQLVFVGTLPCPPLKSCPSSDRSSTYRLSIR